MESVVLEEDLICAICRDIFTDPVTLPCGHNYCEECIDQLRKSCAVAEVTCKSRREARFSCPLCLAPCEAGIHLRRNALLCGIVQKFQCKPASRVDCTVCKGQLRQPAAKTCLDCRESFCTVHVIPHLENRSFSRHVLLRPQSNVGGLCKHHGKEVELYCRTDSTPLCVFCTLTNGYKHHAGHDVVSLSEAMDAVKEGCQVKLDSVRESLAQIKDNLQKLEKIAFIAKDSPSNLQQGYVGFMNRIKLFLQLEENAWQKRFSVAMVMENRKLKDRMGKMKEVECRLHKMERTLQEAQAIQDPLTLIQLLENVDRCDLFQREVLSSRLQEVMEGSSLQPTAAFPTNSPLFHTLQKSFTGEQIRFDPETAHPRLKMDTDRTALWVLEEASGVQATFDPYGGDSDTSFYSTLGAMHFSHGIHYWEVEVRGVSSWAVGVAYGNGHAQVRNGASSWSLTYSRDTQQFCALHQSQAFSCSATAAPGSIGLLLDLDSGILCFYDAELLQGLYTFYCRFTSPVFPLFCLATEEERPSDPPKIRVLNPASNPQPL